MTLKAMLAATAMMAALAGCEQIGSFNKEPPAAAAVSQPQFFENAYAARSDGKFSVPAIPEDQIPVAYRRQIVDYQTAEAPGTIIIDPAHAVLYLVQPEGKAIRYGISVGRDGFGWSGTSVVARKATWPTWTPPPEMIERQPSLEKWRKGQPGGPTNPLGSRALYLYINGKDYGFRIHGTPEWRTIGKRASSGCFRMIQQDVMDLYERVPNGTKVVVLTPSGEVPTKLTLPPPSPAPKRSAPKPAASVTPAAVETTTLDASKTPETADSLVEDTAKALDDAPAADTAAPEDDTAAPTAPATESTAPAPAADAAPATPETPTPAPVYTTPVR
ncbi:L,D-transpeptidase [Falsirhodobacter sp. 20TX0035]|uniref:L,D-transpeptidase n=1 Tax=Falsirhodobacter sp. 20TX0035 TaxID=3022019 RepID=UPI0023305ABD|nr:L,D-transpeptidase [Falsirhodobacter sp. 20TX0035]MDB6453539.1 L,D-transpeptidase [Falsirhodobacter sp. 20TX0035]